MRPKRRRSEDTAERFNHENPIGTPVRCWPGARGVGAAHYGKTRSEAWVLGGVAVVLVSGYPGGIALSHVDVLRPTAPTPGQERLAERAMASVPKLAPFRLTMAAPDVLIVVALMQLALRHPLTPPSTAIRGRQIAGALIECFPAECREFLELGWQSEHDALATPVPAVSEAGS